MDCGGPCGACPNCSDGILNQDEDGVDCGGACDPCATCEDGIKNQNEIGVDCGGACEACGTLDCSTPAGTGEIVYLPANGRDSISDVTAVVLDPYNSNGVNIELHASFKYRGSSLYFCNGFTMKFYGSAVLNLPAGNTQVFTTVTPDVVMSNGYGNNKCVATVNMPLSDLVILSGKKIYFTKTGENKYNLRFCNFPVPRTSDYTFNTNLSANINFSFN